MGGGSCDSPPRRDLHVHSLRWAKGGRRGFGGVTCLSRLSSSSSSSPPPPAAEPAKQLAGRASTTTVQRLPQRSWEEKKGEGTGRRLRIDHRVLAQPLKGRWIPCPACEARGAVAPLEVPRSQHVDWVGSLSLQSIPGGGGENDHSGT